MAPDEDGEGQAPTTTQLMEDGEPPVSEEEEYAEAVTRHAKYLGIDPEIDAEYMWIAEEVRIRMKQDAYYAYFHG